MVRFSIGVASLLSLLVAGGCRRATSVAAAVVCRGFARPAESRGTDGWTFRGLDAGVPPRIRLRSYASVTCRVRFLGRDDPLMHGFSATVAIEPRVWEENKIFKALYGYIRPAARKMDPSVHFAPLIRRMKQDGGY